MFLVISPTGTQKCWAGEHPYMVETEVVYDIHLHDGSRGRMNKRLLSHLLLNDPRWDIRPLWAEGDERTKEE